MGKRLVQQRRGKGSHTYKSPSFRYPGRAEHPKGNENSKGIVQDIIHSQGHSAPLMVVSYENGYNLTIAPEGIKVGDEILVSETEFKTGNIVSLRDIPEGTQIYNIEGSKGDGGKYARASGAGARIISKTRDKAIVKLPSKKQKEFSLNSLATIGGVAGGGRKEKPLLKAGNNFYKMKAKNKLWPKVRGVAMNAVDHPFGGKSTHSKGRPTQSSRVDPPGRKVGKIAPSRTGKKR